MKNFFITLILIVFLSLAGAAQAEESALDCLSKSENMRPMAKAFARILLELIRGNRDTAQAILDALLNLY